MKYLLNTMVAVNNCYWGIIFLLLVVLTNSYSQTEGNLTFSTTLTAHNGGYGTEHVVAVWIQDQSNAFVKTNLRMAKSNHTINNHLTTWKSKSNLNMVDAISGATLTSYSAPITITWNATDVSNTVVADGTYTVFIEETWDHGTSGTSVASFSFEKGANAVHLTPNATTNFTSISLDWVASSTSTKVASISEDNFKVFPNPAKGLINVDIKTLSAINSISIKNSLGQTVAYEKINKSIMGTKLLNISNLNSGVYYVNVDIPNQVKSYTYKVVVK